MADVAPSLDQFGVDTNSARLLFDGVRQGDIEVRLAHSKADIEAAQRLRFRVFYEEMTATPTPEMVAAGLDFDKYDDYCDHLLVIDHSGIQPAVVGTYRLLMRSMAEKKHGFYTATEFDISPLLRLDGEILEVGRACVAAPYRNRPTMQRLWRGLIAYLLYHDVKALFGCGSLPGTDPQALAEPLSYLHYNHLAPEFVRAKALPERYVRTDILPAREVDSAAAVADLDTRGVMSTLPTLIKGYLRIGGYIGDGAVIDHEFGTTDVCIIVVTDLMAQKYFKHYLKT